MNDTQFGKLLIGILFGGFIATLVTLAIKKSGSNPGQKEAETPRRIQLVESGTIDNYGYTILKDTHTGDQFLTYHGGIAKLSAPKPESGTAE